MPAAGQVKHHSFGGRLLKERISAPEGVVQLNRFKEGKDVEDKILGEGRVSGVFLR
jgi:hypothetical protein